MTERNIVNEFKMICKDYECNNSIFNEDDEKVSILKDIINNKLERVDKTIILLYVDYQSYRKLGKTLGLDKMTIRREVLRIRDKIKAEYERTIADNRIGGVHS
jgi:DNA-directed RNA polymerase specialized sigma24 family protein